MVFKTRMYLDEIELFVLFLFFKLFLTKISSTYCTTKIKINYK